MYTYILYMFYACMNMHISKKLTMSVCVFLCVSFYIASATVLNPKKCATKPKIVQFGKAFQ